MVLTLLLFVLGVAALVGGAWCLVAGSSRVAERLGIPSLLVGLTVVAWGTSAPELFVSLAAAARDSQDIMLGNIIGSNLANIGLVLGLAMLFMRPTVDPDFWRRDLWFLLAATGGFAWLLADGRLDARDGVLLMAGFAVYTLLTIRAGLSHARSHQAANPGASRSEGLPRNLGLIVAGGLGLYFGADWIVRASVDIAAALGVPEMIVGWTLVAVGTSLPELAATIVAAVRRESGIALGNVVGSNLFNLLAVGGPAAILRTVEVEPGFLDREYAGLCVVTGLLLLLWFIKTGRARRTVFGLLLLSAYALVLARRFGLDLGL